MKKTEESQPKNFSGRFRTSLITKLNFKMLGRLISGFFALNIVMLAIAIFLIFWKTEEGALLVVETAEPHLATIQDENYSIGNYIITKNKYYEGYNLPSFIQSLIKLKYQEGARRMQLGSSANETSVFEKICTAKYSINFVIDEENYGLSYDLGKDLRLIIYLIVIVLVFEFLIAILNIQKGYRIIRKTLKPLTELSETAKALNVKVRSQGTTVSDSDIKDLAGAISNIDAQKLDSGIDLDSSQEELKDLAFAINDMLNRINSSYKSQIRFVSDASHELRTPISVIQGYVNLLDRWGKKDEKTMQESIDAIKDETQSMKDLVEQLLFLARGDNETIQLHKEVFDVCDIVERIVNETEMIDPNHAFKIQMEKPAYIEADKQLIKQAVRILVDNSIKYSPDGETISLKVSKVDEKVHIIVQDSGIGIAPEDVSKIFDRFYRSDESRARKTGGSGLGLSIARWIIERHDAHFEVVSRVDLGTRITIVMSGVKNE
ncbi:MAG: ATP-binding protein [Gudongella sp.]|jgi:signal transduction histidine kinase|nr:ATP-binding protein [Gudongella sp.]